MCQRSEGCGLSLYCRLGLPWCFITILNLWECSVSVLLSQDMMINGQLGYLFLDCNLEKSTYFFLESPFTSLLYLSQGVKCLCYTFWCISCCVIRYTTDVWCWTLPSGEQQQLSENLRYIAATTWGRAWSLTQEHIERLFLTLLDPHNIDS